MAVAAAPKVKKDVLDFQSEAASDGRRQGRCNRFTSRFDYRLLTKKRAKIATGPTRHSPTPFLSLRLLALLFFCLPPHGYETISISIPHRRLM